MVAVAIEDAFDLSQSYGLRLEWDPFVKSQRLLNGATVAGKGVQTLTRSRHGLRMVSEYLSFRRPDSVAMTSCSCDRSLERPARRASTRARTRPRDACPSSPSLSRT